MRVPGVDCLFEEKTRRSPSNKGRLHRRLEWSRGEARRYRCTIRCNYNDASAATEVADAFELQLEANEVWRHGRVQAAARSYPRPIYQRV